MRLPDIHIPRAVRRQRKLKRYAYVGVPIAVLLVLIIWMLARTPVGYHVKRSDLWIAKVHHGTLNIVVSTTGTFKPIVERWITAASPGVVESVSVQPGDSVKPKTILATLSNPTLESALVQAKADLANAVANRASLKAQLTNELLDLEGSLATAAVNSKTAKLKEEAEKSLFSKHIVSKLEYQSTKLTSIELEQLVSLTRQRVAIFRESIVAQERAAKAQVDALTAVLSDKQQQVDSLHVTANLEGVVQEVAIQSGQTLALGENIARVVNPKSLKITLQVPASLANEVVTGQKATLELATSDQKQITGHVTRISPTIDNGNVDVDVIPDGTLPADIRPNLAVTGQIHIADITSTTYIQRPAYANANSSMTLYRLTDNGKIALPVNVHFGASSDQYIQILSGLNNGDEVIVSDTSNFADAKQVYIR
jgi:HlyD family secretion protein